MSSKKVHTPTPETKQTPAQPAGQKADSTQAVAPEASPELAALAGIQEQLKDAQAQAAEYKDGWQRSVADFQNYRRRIESGKAGMYQMAVGDIVKRYLPVLDDMERAMDSRPVDLAWANGVELICRKLQSILEAEGLKRIEAVGQKFDPNFHEAISQEPAEGVESGTVLGIVRNGYMLGDHVIRPAMVRVAQ